MSEDRGLLSRWSQRKAAARRGGLPPEPAPEVPPERPAQDQIQDQPQDETVAAETPAEVSAEAAADEMPALPSIDELTADSDYTGFLHEKVPELLRRAALRKLWTSDPVLANLDGLNDYCEDYHAVDTTITAAQTAYRVGRGYMDAIEEKLDQVDRVLDSEDDGDREIESAPVSSAQESATASSEQTASLEHNDAGKESADAPQRAAPGSMSADSDNQHQK